MVAGLCAAGLAAGILPPWTGAAAAATTTTTAEAAPGGATASCPASAATVDAAGRAAVHCGDRVEIAAGRTEYSQAFANPDGTSTILSSPVPQRVHRADGSWTDVDTTLRRPADGSLVPVATLADVSFSPGGSGLFVTYRRPGAVLTLSWPTPLTAPTVHGDSATYPDALPGVDLVVSATPTGFRHVLVVRTPAAAANPSLARIRYLVGGNVTVKSTNDGRVRFADVSGRTVAMSADAAMWDSAVDPGANGEVATGVSAAVLDRQRANPPVELRSNAARPGVTARSAPLGVSAVGGDLVLTPDRAMLTDRHAAFPLYVDPSIAPVYTKWAYADNADISNSLATKAWIGLNPGDGRLYRSYIDFPTTSGSLTFKSKHVLSVKFNIELYHSWSCSPTPAYLYRPDGNITVSNGGRMSWSTRPLGSSAIYLATASGNANKAGGCGVIQPDMLMTFSSSGFTADVQYAAKHNFNVYSVGLCACTSTGGSESTQDRWKKFYVDSRTTLAVTYNTVPATPANLTASGVACGGAVGTYSPVLQAQYVDADTSDTLTGSFRWQQLPSGTVNTVTGPAKPANNYGSVQLSLGSAAEGVSYQFQVQTNDGHDVSPWSPWCGFTVNAVAPSPPLVTSTDYPQCDPAQIDTCVASGGPGQAGTFTFSEPAGTAGESVVSYRYGWTNPPTNTVAATSTGGPSPALRLTPPRYGLNTLYVTSVNLAGAPSGTTIWKFLVNGPSAPAAYWPLDSLRGHDFHDQIGTADLTPTNVAWTPDLRYVGTATAPADTAAFAGTSQATASVPAFDTAGSVSVAAWVRLPSTSTGCSGNATAVSVDADTVATNNHVSGIFLSFNCSTGKWRVRLPDRNVAKPSLTDAWATATAVAGRWTYLVGVWDAAEHKLRLYVDGVLNQEVTPSSTWLTSRGTGWRATGPVVVGRDRWNDTDGGHLTGDIADVRIWNRVVTVDDLAGTDADPVNGVPAVVGLMAPMQVGWWDFNGGVDCFCGSVVDGAYFGRPLNLDPGWVKSPPTSAFIYDGHDGNDAATFNGAGGYASTTDTAGAHQVLRTDQSYTVSAWVRLASTCANTSDTAVSQDGVLVSAFALEYNCANDKFAFWVAATDSSSPTHPRAWGPAAPTKGEWHHLVGVYDASAAQLRLYVDGVLQGSTAAPATVFNATGSLVVGRQWWDGAIAGSFHGDVDEVGVWQGVLSDRQIADLYGNS